jgi:hypothetical protein
MRCPGVDEQTAQFIEAAKLLDDDDRTWILACMRAVILFEPADTKYALNAMLNHRRRVLTAKLERLNDFHV